MKEIEKIQALVLKKEKEGKVVINTIEGLQEIELAEFIKQPAEGILYDLNKDKATVLTFIEDEKWINDYACGLVITELKKQKENQKKKNAEIVREQKSDLIFVHSSDKQYFKRVNSEIENCAKAIEEQE